ncbi:50S ribosomal protein L5 [Meiothermus granaticius]|uniref:Large ribosomal subunit protein uL5 n=1 Tax=Meiothermus granaticius NBRC 107808 TaxID=1227551 RepID=A0A399FCG6_9DEIN|nr:50S ribosomal protein L5 [Meiothermus granaticius]MCL6527409.1 50S ribosomal protein L5 [Thermaceae bacterium]RIH92371.1 50S ribosomal protein L5 [Meiothermus granaticius NBRC 107808]GEM87407.1 50S ribosomal protein L5 [Meiothermus granaticius NBRC 107808]
MALEVALKQHYKEHVRPELMKRFGYTNPMAAPRLVKIVVNQGLGEAKEDSRILEKAGKELAVITGQQPAVTKAKKSISNFKLRQGMPIGLRVTLRGDRMWIFAEKLIHIALPRIRDFRGVNPGSFDGRGNYNLGLREQAIFPEITFDMVDAVRGMDVAVVTTARNDEEAKALLELLGFPFRK